MYSPTGRRRSSATTLPTVRARNELPSKYRIFSIAELASHPAVVSTIPATAGCAHSSPRDFFRQPSMDLFFDRIQRGDPFQSFCCHRRFVRYLDVVELPAYVRPTSRRANASRFIDLLEPRVTIRLQHPLEL